MNENWKEGQIALTWWKRLTSDEAPMRGARRGQTARMRRAVDPETVLEEPEALRLIGWLPSEQQRQAGVLAGVLAHVKEHDQGRIGRRIGCTSLDEPRSALLHELRLRRLLQTDREGLLQPMRRMVAVARGRINIEELTFLILRWGTGVRQTFLCDYYNVKKEENVQ